MPAAVRREEPLDGALVHVQSTEKDPLLAHDLVPLPPLHVLPDEYACLVGFGRSKMRFFVYVVLCVATGGILCIAVSWWPWLFTLIARKRGVGMELADFVLVTGMNGDVEELVVHGSHRRWFEYKKQRYLYSADKKKFERVAAALHESCSSVLHRMNEGMSSDAVVDRLHLFGPNTIEIPCEPLHRVLFHKVVHPFYLFQLISVVLWLEEDYYTYSFAILGMSVSSILYEVVTQVQNARQMQALVQCSAIVSVIRNAKEQLVEAKDLVVGDIVLVDEAVVAADMILIAGECTVDESSLTGEAIPVTKVRLYDQKKYMDDKTMQKSAVLSAGSTVLRINGDVKAVVQKTGFSTSKGELFRSILYPESISFRIVTDSYRYLMALGVIALVTTIQRIFDAIAAHSSMYDLLISVFDLISTAIPAALPMVLTVGIGFSLTRLNDADIFCIDAQRINLSGHIDCFCFDKTGTLTTESVDFVGIDIGRGLSNDYSNVDIHLGLGSCHGLTENYGTILGYPLEMSMFGTTNFSLQTTSRGLLLLEYGQDVALYKERFAFDASVQRSSVIVKHLAMQQLFGFVKGSPEAIAEICDNDSMPPDYEDIVNKYVRDGYYVLALAMKKMKEFPGSSISRSDVESDVKFLCFLLFVNPIKSDSNWVVQTLQNADIDIHIITGDNALTAIHVAREVGLKMNAHVALIDNFKGQLQYQLHYGCNDTDVVSIRESNSPSLPQQIGVWHRLQDAIVVEALLQQYDVALTGSGLECLVGDAKFVNILPRVVQETKIFARIKPQMKTWIVQKLMAMGKHVGMTGDGTNDCGALKAAHVGLALSDAEASIVAPFTSRKKDIKDVVDLIKEGRCALMTSLVAFKYMVMYPIIDTTLITVLNHIQATFSNNQYLFDDLIVVLGLSVLMLRTGPSSQLTKDRPPNSLFAPSVLWSVAGQTLLFAFYFTIPQLLAHHQPWFCALPDVIAGNKTIGNKTCYEFRPNESGDMTTHSHEVSIVWTTGHLQYLILAFAFNIKDPFRASAWSNRWFIFYTFVLSILLSIILIEPANWFNKQWLDLTTPLPQEFCYQVFGLFVSNIAASTLFEHILNKWAITS